MKKTFRIIVLLMFLFSIAAPVLATTISNKVDKLENEVAILQTKLAKTKSKTQIARLKTTIKGHQAKIEELKSDPGYKIEETNKAGEPTSKLVILKGGLAGGAFLLGAEYLMPMGTVNLGGELGYAIGSEFGVIVASGKVLYPIGNYFVGAELSYGGYSKDVKEVAGLSGTIKSGVGIGVVGGTSIGPIQLSAGYNTILGLRADAGYKLYL